ncbi:DAHP synthetase [Nadsonia fulvescens var. elongata DSM 6958]|uniref:Phospho-2-dehydro-3-deoxyheptonate aldolase n=1 Tax=Nadsonia fulvescens var. elongata DSM 6958 TaxID=857566 RepID=A0A1E3PKL6_9ASCO|nr:DAHP synthetase [Nadsonia fulvescens var. elongata DSM 6958]
MNRLAVIDSPFCIQLSWYCSVDIFVVADPEKLVPSEGAKSAAKLRSKSNEMGEIRPILASLKPSSTAIPEVPAWTPTSWQSKPITQDVVYDDYKKVETALEKLESLPPLVHPQEICNLRQKLKQVANGEAFILQGGDCAELFDYCNQERIEAKMKVLLQMSLVLLYGTNLPIVRIGRIAGQYAKPRSKLTEMVNGVETHSFRGDNINGFELDQRVPDPERLVSAYFHSAATLNFIRSSLANGFADLHKPFDWSLSHVQDDVIKERYQAIVSKITESLKFMGTIGADKSAGLKSVDFFTSHEALMLEYEQSLTRELKDPETGEKHWYNTSGHFIWIGDRTRQLDGAHVEFFRGVQNPIGIKVGPSMKAQELADLLDIVDPHKETGRVTLITRYGKSRIEGLLPGHIQAVKKAGHKVVWISDPCHGNTQTASNGYKTRHVDDVVGEIMSALKIHEQEGSNLGGIHLELTGEEVTECIGGSSDRNEDDLILRYDTVCDPRLSLTQSLDVAFLIADWFQKKNKSEQK